MENSIQLNSKEQNIAFFYLPSGSGHLSPCKSIKEEIDSRNMENVKTFLYSPSQSNISKFIIETFYKFISSDYPTLWAITYEVSRLKLVIKFQYFLAKKYLSPNLEKYINENNITKIVCSHFALNEAIAKYIENSGKDIKYFTIITDPYSVPKHWAYEQKAKCIVFSNLAKSMLKRHIWKFRKENYDDRIFVFNPIIHKKFASISADKQELAKKHNIDISKLTILFVGGAEGFPKGIQYLSEISKLEIEVNILFVSGKNKKQFDFASDLANRSKYVKFHVYGYIDFMDDLINIADMSIVKSGASVVFENMALCKPMIISTYLHNQEIGTKNYVVENKFGFYIKNKKKLAKKIQEINLNREILDTVKENMKNNNFKIGTTDVADFILND